MKKNATTRTQRRNARKRTGTGAKWSPIWDGRSAGGVKLFAATKSERASLVEFARGLHRSQPQPGWFWTVANANAARKSKTRGVRRAGIGRD